MFLRSPRRGCAQLSSATWIFGKFWSLDFELSGILGGISSDLSGEGLSNHTCCALGKENKKDDIVPHLFNLDQYVMHMIWKLTISGKRLQTASEEAVFLPIAKVVVVPGINLIFLSTHLSSY